MKIYLVKHQAHGVVWEYPFSHRPTEAQLELVWQFCFGIHGASHAKTPGEPYWQQVVEANVLGPSDRPAFEPHGIKSVASASQTSEAVVSGRAQVTPPKKGS